jgi:hypothetical protein
VTGATSIGSRLRLALSLVLLGAASLASADEALLPSEAVQHVGKTAKVCGHVASTTYAAGSKGQPTFLNLGKPYPDQEFTALIWGTCRPAFSYAPESLRGETICVRGMISTYGGKAQIVVSDPAQLERVGGGQSGR